MNSETVHEITTLRHNDQVIFAGRHDLCLGRLIREVLWKHRNELVDAHAGMSLGRAA